MNLELWRRVVTVHYYLINTFRFSLIFTCGEVISLLFYFVQQQLHFFYSIEIHITILYTRTTIFLHKTRVPPHHSLLANLTDSWLQNIECSEKFVNIKNSSSRTPWHCRPLEYWHKWQSVHDWNYFVPVGIWCTVERPQDAIQRSFYAASKSVLSSAEALDCGMHDDCEWARIDASTMRGKCFFFAMTLFGSCSLKIRGHERERLK